MNEVTKRLAEAMLVAAGQRAAQLAVDAIYGRLFGAVPDNDCGGVDEDEGEEVDLAMFDARLRRM